MTRKTASCSGAAALLALGAALAPARALAIDAVMLETHVDTGHVFYLGPCPVTVSFSTEISSDVPGSLSTRWIRSDGGTSSPVSVPLVGATGFQVVTTTWTLGDYTAAFQPFNGWVRLEATGATVKESKPATFTVTCKKDGNPKFDLQPDTENPFSGFVKARNAGPDPAPASRLVIQCTKDGMPAGMGCPPFPVGAGSPPNAIPLGEWAVPSPSAIWVHVPALQPGVQGFTRYLPPWNQLQTQFAPGFYTFTLTITADAPFVDANPGNNTKTGHLQVTLNKKAPFDSIKVK